MEKVARILLHLAKNQGEWQIGHLKDETKRQRDACIL